MALKLPKIAQPPKSVRVHASLRSTTLDLVEEYLKRYNEAHPDQPVDRGQLIDAILVEFISKDRTSK